MDDARLRRIRFVTEHYPALRSGVTRTVFVPCILAVAGLEYLLEYLDPARTLTGLILGLTNIFGFAALGVVLWLRTRKWLDRRFGRVLSAAPLLQIFGLVVCQLGYFAASRLDESYGAGAGLPSSKFVFIACLGLWCAVRLWPYSVHYFVVVAVALGLAFAFGTLSGEHAIELWEVRAFGLTLLAWTAAGFIDLAILCKALPRHPEAEAVSVDA